MHTSRFLLPALGKRWRFGPIFKQTVLWEAIWTFAVAPFVIGLFVPQVLFARMNDKRTSVACLMVAFGLSAEIPADRPFVTMKVVFVLDAALRKLRSCSA